MANTVNPYQAPSAAVADAGSETQPVKVFSISGRIGRARYIAYGMGFYILFGFVAGILAAALGPIGAVLTIVAWVAIVVIGFMLTIQRCHDFNMSGWLSLVMLVPLANLIFLFIPGTDGQPLRRTDPAERRRHPHRGLGPPGDHGHRHRRRDRAARVPGLPEARGAGAETLTARAIKRGLAWALGGLVVAAVLLVAAAPALIDIPAVQAEIQRRLSRALGGQVSWEALDVRLLPAPHGELRGLRIEIGQQLSAAADEVDVTSASGRCCGTARNLST
jgi:hypothetical protein